MTLTPQMIQAMNTATGNNVPLDPTAPPSRADEVLKIGQQAQAANAEDDFNATPHLGQGAAGEAAGNALRAFGGIGIPLEKGLDKTLGRGINAIEGKGFVPTDTGQQAEDYLNEGAQENDTFAGKVGTAIGTVAPYLIPGEGEEAAGARLASKVPDAFEALYSKIPQLADALGLDGKGAGPKIAAWIAQHAPGFAKNAAIGTEQTQSPVEGIAAGVGGEVSSSALKGAGKLLTPADRGAKALDYAVDLAMPKATTAEREAAIASGRTTDPGFFKKSDILPTSYDNQVGASVADVVSPKNTVAKNVDAISQKISQVNSGVRSMLADNKVPFNTAQLRSRLNQAKDANKLVFASDATAEKTYNAVVDEFMKHVQNKDTLGLFDARQTFDKVPAIKKLLDSEALGENVRKQIVLDVRRAANEYVAEQLPANNPYRPALMQESHMIEALGNIASKNAADIGKNNIQILTEKYPIIKWLVGGTAAGLLGGAGIGVGSTIINSTD